MDAIVQSWKKESGNRSFGDWQRVNWAATTQFKVSSSDRVNYTAVIVKDTSVINYPQAFRWFRKANCRVSSKTFGKRSRVGNFGCTYDQRFCLVYVRSKRSQKKHWALNTRQSNAIYSRKKWPHSLYLNWRKLLFANLAGHMTKNMSWRNWLIKKLVSLF